MQASNIPDKFQVPFGNSAAADDIQYPIPLTAGATRASLTLGFPPANFTPVAAGGTPPFGADENGILYWTTAWLQWVQAGGAPAVYDATFQSQIGGYPKGAYVLSGTTTGLFWISTTDNNTTNPDTGGVGWSSLTALILTNAALTGTPTAPTAPVNTNNTQISSTAYADRSSSNAGATAQANAESYATPTVFDANPGYILFPGGLIRNFGTSSNLSTNASATITLAKPFLTGALGRVICSPVVGAGTESGQSASGVNVSNSTITVSNTSSGPVVFGISWEIWGR